MNQSEIVRRIFVTITILIVFMIVLTSVTYIFLAKSAFTQIRENELTPKANALGELVRSYYEHELDHRLADNILTNSDLLGANILVLGRNRETLFASGPLAEQYYQLFSDEFEPIFHGNTVKTPRTLEIVRSSVVTVGTPVFAEDGRIIAAVLLFVPMVEIMASTHGMNSALLLSLVIALPIIGICAYLMAERFTKPLRKMNEVAISMAAGDFSARTSTGESGELGELGHSLNFLARELSGTIGQLTLERNRLRDIINGLHEGIIAVDAECKVTHINTALTLFFTGNRALSDGTDDAEKLALIPFPEIWEDFDAVLKGRTFVERQLSCGEKILHFCITPLMDINGAIEGAVGLVADITESERLENTRREYVANVSHELRSPLTALRGLVEPMRDGMVKNEETRMRYLDIILRETLRLSRLIDDLMELSRLQSGTLSMEIESVNTAILFSDLQEKYASVAEDHGLNFKLTFDPEMSPNILTNSDRLEEVLVILLDNAIKYTPEGGNVTLSAYKGAGRLHISVADTGIGISPEDCRHVFDRFYKVDKAHTTKGSGLGLSIAHEILEKLGCDLTVESTLGEGSTFRFSVPLS